MTYMQCDACGRQDHPTRNVRAYGMDTTVCAACTDSIDDDDEMFGQGECTCRRTGRGGNDPDAGWKVDKWCPIHGRDPDEEYEKMRERKWDAADD